MNAASAVRVQIARTEGSTPRETGASLVVTAGAIHGTIGGGHLEFDAIARAQGILAGAPIPSEPQRVALGPSLGQCCGGVVWLRYELLDAESAAQAIAPTGTPVALFGGGHVGRALAKLLADLPFRLHWIDSRDEIFPQYTPAHVQCEHSNPVQDAVPHLEPGSAVVIMSFSHAEDLDILAACLLRAREKNDLPWIGLIGSKSKWATFRHRLEARGFGEADFARVTCPIGLPNITGPFRKQPEVIAVSVAAQLLAL